MSFKTLETKTIKMIPSPTLKEYLKKFDFRFTQKDLLKFIEDYAPTYETKINLLEEAAQEFSDKSVVLHAKKLIKYHKRSFDEFMTPSDDCVYEVEIHINPDDYDETYTVKTFDDALILIDNYLKRYRHIGCKDNELSKYNVIKKTTIAPQKPSDLDCKVGELGRCVLGYKRVIKSVEMHYNGKYLRKCNGVCMDCKNECIDVHEPHFPAFLQPYDLVAFKTNWSYDAIESRGKIYKCERNYEHIEYGILTTDMTEYDDDTHVVLLANEYIRGRNAFAQYDEGYYHIYDAHEHPSYAVLFKPDLSEVDKDILADYEYAVQALKKIEEQN